MKAVCCEAVEGLAADGLIHPGVRAGAGFGGTGQFHTARIAFAMGAAALM
ncbi:MAG: hypothetical protein LBV73_02765 [Paraburkholderia sp.]|nr:hypothetical protein [Paraburkholderia sp.]